MADANGDLFLRQAFPKAHGSFDKQMDVDRLRGQALLEAESKCRSLGTKQLLARALLGLQKSQDDAKMRMCQKMENQSTL